MTCKAFLSYFYIFLVLLLFVVVVVEAEGWSLIIQSAAVGCLHYQSRKVWRWRRASPLCSSANLSARYKANSGKIHRLTLVIIQQDSSFIHSN